MGIKGRFKSIDDAYQQYIKDLVIPKKAKNEDMGDLGPIDKARTFAGVTATADGKFSPVVRYGVPAAGLTAAGMGLVAVMNQFGGPEDQPEPGTLEILQAANQLRG